MVRPQFRTRDKTSVDVVPYTDRFTVARLNIGIIFGYAADMTVLTPGHQNARSLDPGTVRERVAAHMLADGFEFILDLDRSHGSTLVDARDGSEYLDLFTFFASSALGMNHDALAGDPAFLEEIAAVAVNKPSNSDIYTVPMARFVDTFGRVLGDPALPHLFFIDGGALAVENALKIAFDWKSRWNEGHGIDPALGTQRAAPGARLPRAHRVHDEPDQHRPGQGRAVPQVRLAAHPLPGRQPARRRGRAGRGRGRGAGGRAPGVRGRPARHRLLHRRADPGRGRRQPLPPVLPAGDAGAVPRVRRALHPRRGADRGRPDRHRLGLPAARADARTWSSSARRPRSAA